MTITRLWKQPALAGLALAAGLWLGAGPAPAKTYYVSQSTGNDNWTGLAESPGNGTGPWKTLAKASAAALAPGDMLLLKCGDTWNEELRPQGEGTPQKPIVIAAYGQGPKPVIDRQDDKQDLCGIALKDQGGFKIVGLEFNKCMTGLYAEYSDHCPTKKFLWIEDCYFHDSLTYGGYQKYPHPKNISLGVCLFSFERQKRIVLQDITVKNCVFRRLASAFWTNSPDNFNKNASFVYNFANLVFDGCRFEAGYQWQLGLRGVDGGAVRNCVTCDVGRGFRAWNGVAGAMFFRCRNWVIEDSEWGFVDIGQGSADGEAFDWEGNCDNSVMRNCLFHDTDGPGFLLCCYASDGNPNRGIKMENCVLNAKAKRPIQPRVRAAIINTTDWTDATWTKCRFYLSPGEALMKVMDHEKEKKSKFVNCVVENLSQAGSTPNLAGAGTATASSAEAGSEAGKAVDRSAATAWKAAAATNQWLQIAFAAPQTVNAFRLKEAPGSSITRYAIESWDAAKKQWISCFNGLGIGPEFLAPIVARTTRGVRLVVLQTAGGPPALSEFEVYNDTAGEVFNDPTGQAAEGKLGKQMK